MPQQENAARIVFLDRETISPSTRFRPFSFKHEFVVYDKTAPDEVGGRIADADIVIVNKVKVPGSAIRSAPRLKLIAVSATGTDNIDGPGSPCLDAWIDCSRTENSRKRGHLGRGFSFFSQPREEVRFYFIRVFHRHERQRGGLHLVRRQLTTARELGGEVDK